MEEAACLDYLEIKVVEHCNMRCAALVSYIWLSRRYFPNAEIHVVTNGLLLEKMPDTFFEQLKENDIQVQISYYPEPSNQAGIDREIEILKRHGCGNAVYTTNVFEVDTCFTQDDDQSRIQAVSQRCASIANATNLYRGYLYRCTKPLSIRHYDKKFGTQFADLTDGIYLYDENITAAQILRDLKKATRTCRYCTKSKRYIPWGQSKGEKEEWLNTSINPKLVENMGVYEQLELSKSMDCLAYSMENGNGRLRKMSLYEVGQTKGKPIYLWCLDVYSLDRTQYYLQNLRRTGKLAGVCMPQSLKRWFDPTCEIRWTGERELLVTQDSRIVVILSADLSDLHSVVRKIMGKRRKLGKGESAV